MIKLNILTPIENRVLNKKLSSKRLTQVEANYLSRAIRPKLKKLEEAKQIDTASILQKIEYNQKAKSIEIKIRNLIEKSIENLDSIILYGSAIQTNYSSYNDIDVLVITKDKIWDKEKEKYASIKIIKEKARDIGLILDVQVITKKTFYSEYSSSPDLVYQLKDCKIVYGTIQIPKKIHFSKLDLQMKLDWSDIEEINPRGIEIYKALRNALLVRLLFNRIIDNQKLKQNLYDETGKNLIDKLKNDSASIIERKIALNYLKELSGEIKTNYKRGKMGKNRTIKILANIIGNIVVHKILIKNTNKPESISHLTKEVGAYGENASEIAQEFNWNDKDKLKIHEEALKKFNHNMEKYYPDVVFPENEVHIVIDETIEEFI